MFKQRKLIMLAAKTNNIKIFLTNFSCEQMAFIDINVIDYYMENCICNIESLCIKFVLYTFLNN